MGVGKPCQYFMKRFYYGEVIQGYGGVIRLYRCYTISASWDSEFDHQFVSSDAYHALTVLFLSFRTDRSGQTVQTQIRWLLEEQSDQRLHCLLFCLHLLDTFLNGKAMLFKF